MSLIDELEYRADSVAILQQPDFISVTHVFGETWGIELDGVSYPITTSAFDSLLNMLHIPIKYLRRLVSQGGQVLAADSVNFGIAMYGELSFLTEEFDTTTVTQVFPGRCMYLPGVKINDLVVDALGSCNVLEYICNKDTFSATYLSDETVEIGGRQFSKGLKVLYSDCFKVTPRFDGVLYLRDSSSTLIWSSPATKFRVASCTISQIIEQAVGQIASSISGLNAQLVHALEVGDLRTYSSEELIARLVSDLRMNKKSEAFLLEKFAVDSDSTLDALLSLASVGAVSSFLTPQCVRDIELAISRFIVGGSFK